MSSPRRSSILASLIRRFLPGAAVLICSALAARADDPLLEEWRYAVSRNLRFASPALREHAQNRALDLCERLLMHKGITFRQTSLHGVSDPAFELLALDRNGASALNRMAAHAATNWNGLRLVYAPTLLMGGASGFYSQEDHALGISNLMVEVERPDSTFAHEIIHASHGASRREGRLDPLSPSARVNVPAIEVSLSRHARGYRRVQTFEELEAHAESIRVLLSELPAALPTRATHDEIRELERVLGEIQFTATEGEAIARVTSDLASQALERLQSGETPVWARIPRNASAASSTELWQLTIRLDGHVRSSTRIPTAGTVDLSWRIHLASGAPAPTIDSLIEGLERARLLAESLRPTYDESANSMAWMIERADAPRTDFNRVQEAGTALVRKLEIWRAQNRRR